MSILAPSTPGRRRLTGRNERRGTRTGFSVRGAVLFGAAFVVSGTAIVLVGQRVIPVDPSTVHAPWWVLTAAGLSFAGSGLAVWGMAVTQQRAERHRREAMRRYAGSEAHADHAWNPRGDRSRQWQRAAHALGGAIFLSIFLSIFNWWAFGAEGPLMVKIIVILFDLVLLFAWWEAVVRTGRALKFGDSRIVFDHFPYLLSEPVVIRWVPPKGVGRARRGEFTLRCVEEFHEERGSGEDRSKWMVHEELVAETHTFDDPHTFAPGREVEFRYVLPEGVPPSSLSAVKPVFWEFEAKLMMPGFDFEERYLVPVYTRG